MDRKYIIMIIVALVVILLICGMVLFPSLKKKLEEKKDIEIRESWQQEEAHTSDIEVKNNGFIVYKNNGDEVNIEEHKDIDVYNFLEL